MKEIINNKLKLPTTWTKKKMASLFLMTWLSVNGTEAGQAFKNCLSFQVFNSYNVLLNFDFAGNSAINSGRRLRLCCDSFQCVSKSPTSCSSGAFSCVKSGEAILCSDSDGLGKGCGGVIRDTQITSNATISSADCPSDITSVANYLVTFTPEGVNDGYAH